MGIFDILDKLPTEMAMKFLKDYGGRQIRIPDFISYLENNGYSFKDINRITMRLSDESGDERGQS